MAQNPLVQVNVSLAAPVDGNVPITIGHNTYYVALDELRRLWTDRDEASLRIFLLLQMAVVLQTAGVNPVTATNAQIKSAIEAKAYWV